MTMQGKVCLITGGNNGIRKGAAQALARMGATVVIVGRSAQKTCQVVEEIRLATGSRYGGRQAVVGCQCRNGTTG
jgi:NAD(P)-dependent dehydrogenase (short-subunit alcohol dehydrogenase family)